MNRPHLLQNYTKSVCFLLDPHGIFSLTSVTVMPNFRSPERPLALRTTKAMLHLVSRAVQAHWIGNWEGDKEESSEWCWSTAMRFSCQLANVTLSSNAGIIDISKCAFRCIFYFDLLSPQMRLLSGIESKTLLRLLETTIHIPKQNGLILFSKKN